MRGCRQGRGGGDLATTASGRGRSQRTGSRRCAQETAPGQRRGHSTGNGRGRTCANLSSLPWQPVDPGKDTIPSPLPFSEDVGSMLQMPPVSWPRSHFANWQPLTTTELEDFLPEDVLVPNTYRTSP